MAEPRGDAADDRLEVTVLRGASVYAPTPLGLSDVTIVGGTIVEVATRSSFGTLTGVKDLDVSGLILVPGFVDAHVHIQGGGGTSGPESRPPEMPLSTLTSSGVTTAVTCMGNDVISRSLQTALMRALALEREGLTAYLYTGGFGFPLPTLTGSVQADLALFDRVLGVKLAIAETSFAHLTEQEFARVIGDTYVGARLAGKLGVVHVHIGEGRDGLPWLQEQIGRTGVPWSRIVATHVNNSEKVLSEAVGFGLQGGHLDITALRSPAHGREHAIPPAAAIVHLLHEGIPLASISMSSDAGASRVIRDESGQEKHVVRTPHCLLEEIQRLVATHQVPLEQAIQVVTANPAAQLGLRSKGRIAAGMDADIAILDADLRLQHLFARGRPFIWQRKHMRTGLFEPLSWPYALG